MSAADAANVDRHSVASSSCEEEEEEEEDDLKLELNLN